MARKLDKTVDTEAGTVTFAFADKSTVVADIAAFPEKIVRQLALHGLSQKGGDSTASLETLADCIAAVKGVIENLVAGKWSSRVEGIGGPRIGLLVEALARCTGRSLEECETAIKALDADTQKQLRQDSAIRLAINEIRTEREKARAERGEGAVDLMAIMAQGLAAAEAAGDDEDEEEEEAA